MKAEGDCWRWWLGESYVPTRSSIDVIEPAQKPEIPKDARRVSFGFSRALEQETLDGLDEWDQDHDNGWNDHAEMVAS